jgi:hypothetical protein
LGLRPQLLVLQLVLEWVRVQVRLQRLGCLSMLISPAAGSETKTAATASGWAKTMRYFRSVRAFVGDAQHSTLATAATALQSALDRAGNTTQWTTGASKNEMPTDDDVVWLTNWVRATYRAPNQRLTASRLLSKLSMASSGLLTTTKVHSLVAWVGG